MQIPVQIPADIYTHWATTTFKLL